MRGYPDVQLLETLFQTQLKFLEKLAMFRDIGHIHKKPGQIVLINDAFLFPNASQNLGFPRCGTSACEIALASGFDVAFAVSRLQILFPPERIVFIQTRFVVNQLKRPSIFC